MKIQELKALLKDADRDRIVDALVECYKLFPNNRKKGDVDPVLLAALNGKSAADAVDLEALDGEISDFLQKARDGDYGWPNRRVSQAQRSRWRFQVMKYLKSLERVHVSDPLYGRAMELLEGLYRLLCDNCRYDRPYFQTEDTFRAVRRRLDDLFALLVKKTLAAGTNREILRALLEDALYYVEDMPDDMELNRTVVLVRELKTPDQKTMAVEVAEQMVQEEQEKLAGPSRRKGQEWRFPRGRLDELCSVVLFLRSRLSEPEVGYQYYLDCCGAETPDDAFHFMLDAIADIGGDDDRDQDLQDLWDLWIPGYEYGVRNGLHPSADDRAFYEQWQDEEQQDGAGQETNGQAAEKQ